MDTQEHLMKNIAAQINKYHRFFRKTGFYQFIFRNSIKIILILAALVGIIIYIEQHVIDFDELFQIVLARIDTMYIFAIFFISESVLGLIPPDFFIVWAGSFENPYLAISLLAVLSYLGGIISHRIGYGISFHPKINRYITSRFDQHYRHIKKWGAVFIIIAAMFPLPYAIISIIAGILRYPFEMFVFVSLSRIARFYIYAYLFFSVIT